MSERGSRVRVRPVVEEDEAAFIAAARRSLGLHHGWVRSPTTPATFKEYLARFDGLRSFGFVLELIATGELVGYVNISQVVHDAYQRGILGYAIFVPHQCQGLM